jgi:hypothetical protein
MAKLIRFPIERVKLTSKEIEKIEEFNERYRILFGTPEWLREFQADCVFALVNQLDREIMEGMKK